MLFNQEIILQGTKEKLQALSNNSLSKCKGSVSESDVGIFKYITEVQLMRLKDKVAIITGAANGIGLAAAEKFAGEGAVVAMADYDADMGITRAQELKEKGLQVEFFQVNVADRQSIDSMAEAVKAAFGKIDILINNAGITRDGMLAKLAADDFQAVMDVNLAGVFH
jgi:3-oxoacyl-[acyl-carrier protein] reductase